MDMYFIFVFGYKMCLDIEHDLKVRMLKAVETDSTSDDYNIVNTFLSHNSYIISKLEATSASPFTSDLIISTLQSNEYITLKKGKQNHLI